MDFNNDFHVKISQIAGILTLAAEKRLILQGARQRREIEMRD
jgi:hypothetical protein